MGVFTAVITSSLIIDITFIGILTAVIARAAVYQ
jgi:hypothetical protein